MSDATPDLRPLHGLRLRTARLELRLPDDAEILELAQLAEKGVHPPEEMPFAVAWTDAIGTAGFRDGFAAFHRGLRESWRPDAWNLELGVWASGRIVGAQGMRGERFAETRVAVTGSWLGLEFQGRGYGTEMRQAMLELAFAKLDAVAMESGAVAGNDVSARVSAKLGYVQTATEYESPRGVPVPTRRFRLDRATWATGARPAVEIGGFEGCEALFGC